MNVKYLIIGAGPTGLGAAYRLKELGENDFMVVEKESYSGGLATTFKDEKGFLWDIGGHVQFSHYKYFDELMLSTLGADGWLEHERESWVWMRNRFIPYPFQNNVRYLPKEEMWSCLRGMIKNLSAPQQEKPKNFEDWIRVTFGEGIAELFMLPYNFKVWAFPPSLLSHHWIGERVAVTDLERVTGNVIFEQDDLSWGPNNTFSFPLHGGTGSIWKGVANEIGEDHFAFNKCVDSIEAEKKTVWFTDGTSATYEYLLSTMPLDLLAEAVDELPVHIKEETKELKHSTSHIVGIGLAGKPGAHLEKKCWMYFPESDCPFYRVTVFSNYSPNNVPDPENQWSLMTETSESDLKKVDSKTIVQETIQGLLNTGLIDSEEQVISTWYYKAGYGYPTPSLGRDAILKNAIPELEKLNIYSRGRFGAWKYEVSNQDHSMMQGVEWVNRMVLSVPEVTIHFPSMANANWGQLI